MKKFLAVVLVLIPCVACAFFFSPGGSGSGTGSTTTDASLLVSGTLPAARLGDNSVTAAKLKADSGTPSATTYFRGDNTWATPSGSGTVTEVTGSGGVTVATGTTTPALSLTDNGVTSAKILDNAIKNIDIASDAAIAASKIDLSAYATLASPTFTGTPVLPTPFTIGAVSMTTTGTILNYLTNAGGTTGTNSTNIVFSTSPVLVTPTLGVASATTLDTGQGAYELYAMDQNVRKADNVTFSYITYTELVSNAADGTHKGNLANSGAASNLTTAGDMAYNLATSALTIYDNTLADNVILAAAVKTFSFAIDNVAAADNVLMNRVPRAWTITRWDCSASTDNVIGNLMECATDNVNNCGVVDAVSVGGVTAADAPTTDSTLTDGAIASGAWLRWSTTSVGSALNRFSCTIQYRE